MSVQKEANFWNSTKAAIAKLVGKSEENLTDTELVDAVLETDKQAKTDDTEEKTEKTDEKKVEKTEKEAEKKENTEGDKTDKNSELQDIKATVADLTKLVELQGSLIKLQGESLKKITEFQAKRATGGEKEIEDKKESGRKYEAKHAPDFVD